MNLDTIVPSLMTGGVVAWFGKLGLEWIKGRGGDHKARVDADVQLEQHRDKLTFDLLSAARSELATVRAEVVELRPLQTHIASLDARLAHFDEALGHLEAVLAAREPSERLQAEKLARAFVNRMRRLGEAHGTMMNEIQRVQSEAAVANDVRDQRDRLT